MCAKSLFSQPLAYEGYTWTSPILILYYILNRMRMTCNSV